MLLQETSHTAGHTFEQPSHSRHTSRYTLPEVGDSRPSSERWRLRSQRRGPPRLIQALLIRAVDNNDRRPTVWTAMEGKGLFLKGLLGVGSTLKRSHAGGTPPGFPGPYRRPPAVQMRPADLRQRLVLR